MNLEQLISRYFRLQQDLSIAYRQSPWHGDRIDRLADNLSSTERQIAALQFSNDSRTVTLGHAGE